MSWALETYRRRAAFFAYYRAVKGLVQCLTCTPHIALCFHYGFNNKDDLDTIEIFSLLRFEVTFGALRWASCKTGMSERASYLCKHSVKVQSFSVRRAVFSTFDSGDALPLMAAQRSAMR